MVFVIKHSEPTVRLADHPTYSVTMNRIVIKGFSSFCRTPCVSNRCVSAVGNGPFGVFTRPFAKPAEGDAKGEKVERVPTDPEV